VTAVAPEPGQLETLASLIASRVQEMAGQPERWMDRPAVMDYTGFGATAISRAFAGGGDGHALHCHRVGERGHPRTKRSVVDAWVSGATEDQQRQVCGCPQLLRWTPK
jgi:hypothetical protein